MSLYDKDGSCELPAATDRKKERKCVREKRLGRMRSMLIRERKRSVRRRRQTERHSQILPLHSPLSCQKQNSLLHAIEPPRVVYADGFNARQSFLNPDTEDEKVLFAPKRNPTLTLLLALLEDELVRLRSSQEVSGGR